MNSEVIWNIIDTYFNDNPNALVSHHLDSFNHFFKTDLKQVFREKNPKIIPFRLLFHFLENWRHKTFQNPISGSGPKKEQDPYIILVYENPYQTSCCITAPHSFCTASLYCISVSHIFVAYRSCISLLHICIAYLYWISASLRCSLAVSYLCPSYVLAVS